MSFRSNLTVVEFIHLWYFVKIMKIIATRLSQSLFFFSSINNLIRELRPRISTMRSFPSSFQSNSCTDRSGCRLQDIRLSRNPDPKTLYLFFRKSSLIFSSIDSYNTNLINFQLLFDLIFFENDNGK